MSDSKPGRRILVRSTLAPHDSVEPEAVFARESGRIFGGNVGNLLFMNSVYRTVNVAGTTAVPDGTLLDSFRQSPADIARINAEFDMYVVPLANAFRENWVGVLNRLASTIEQLTIPVVVAGAGAQANFSQSAADFASDKLKAATTRFMCAVLERSASVGVRGELSAEFLRRLGFGDDVVDVIGCPALYAPGSQPVVEKRVSELGPDSPIAMNATLNARWAGPLMQRHAETYRRLVYIPQTNPELKLLLWGEPVDYAPAGIPGDVHHRLYREGRIAFPLDSASWLRLLSEQEFSFGTRIHGTIAALLAGTPAVLLSNDHRTRELAEFHGIPWIRTDESSANLEAAQLYADADFNEFNGRRQATFAGWLKFLDRNDVPHIYQPNQANLDYDNVMADRPANNIITPLGGATNDDLVLRVRWLRQGMLAEQQATAELAKQVAKLSRRIEAVENSWPHRLRQRVRKMRRN